MKTYHVLHFCYSSYSFGACQEYGKELAASQAREAQMNLRQFEEQR